MAAHSPRGSAHLHPSFFAHLMLIHEHTLLTMNFKIQAGSNYVSPPSQLPPRSHYHHLSLDHINFSVSVHPAAQPTPIMGAGAFVTESPDWVTSLTKAFKDFHLSQACSPSCPSHSAGLVPLLDPTLLFGQAFRFKGCHFSSLPLPAEHRLLICILRKLTREPSIPTWPRLPSTSTPSSHF